MRHLTRTALALGALAMAASASAQDRRQDVRHVYDVKAICGKGDGKIAAEGIYYTAINILNPNRETVKVREALALALPGLQMGPLSDPVSGELRPNHAFEIDCPTLMEQARMPDFLKGFAIVEGSGPLTIVAVYTQANRDGDAVSIHTERVPPRRRAGGDGGETCQLPDLIIREIGQPEWDAANGQSVITAVVRNIGSSDAPDSIARLIDPSTLQSTGAPYNATANTGTVPAGGEVTVTFTLPYWVYNPDAELEVTADYKGMIAECDETNNMLEFFGLG